MMMIIFIEFEIYLARRVVGFHLKIIMRLFVTVTMGYISVNWLGISLGIIFAFSLALLVALLRLSMIFSSCLVFFSKSVILLRCGKSIPVFSHIFLFLLITIS